MVYRWLLSYIDKNKFSGNHKLPSENALCRDLKVSRDTVRLALEQLEREGLIYRVRGSGTFFDRETALSRELYTGTTKVKIGMILQGQDGDAESQLIKGVRSVLTEEQMDLRIFLTDNKFSNERRCLQTVVHQHFQGFIIDGVKASMASPNLDCYKAIQRKGIPMIFFNNYYQNLHCPKAGVDNAASAECLIDLLLKAGHRHIAGIFLYDNHQSIEKFQSKRIFSFVIFKSSIKPNLRNLFNISLFGETLFPFLKDKYILLFKLRSSDDILETAI